jgi:hypothetical protein
LAGREDAGGWRHSLRVQTTGDARIARKRESRDLWMPAFAGMTGGEAPFQRGEWKFKVFW